MQEIISPYTIKYTGKLADQHIINSHELAHSILGASKISTSIFHYVFTGKVPKANYKKEYQCVTKAANPGSYEWFQWIIPSVPLAFAYTEDFRLGTELLFQAVWDSVVNFLTRTSGNTMASAFVEINKQNQEAYLEALRLFINATEKRDQDMKEIVLRQAEIIEKMEKHQIETLPELSKVNKTNAVNLVAPIGTSCNYINNHFYNGFNVDIDPAKAEIIRSTEPD